MKTTMKKVKGVLSNLGCCLWLLSLFLGLVYGQDVKGQGEGSAVISSVDFEKLDFKEKRTFVGKIRKGEIKLNKTEKKRVLRDIIKNEKDSVSKENAIKELAKIKDNDVLDELIANLKSSDEEIALASLDSLVEYSTYTKARNAVVNTLSSKSEKIRWQAVITCGEMKNPNCVDGLVKIINTEKNEQIVRSAFESLYKIRTTKALNLLKNLSTAGKNENIRKMAANVLKAIEVERKKKK